jgi:hypothetical protein
MSVIKSVILADDRPANLPLSEDIVKLCRDAGYDYNVRGIPIIDQSRGVTSAWVKYGNVKMSEALTQDWVGKVLNPNPDAPVRIPTVYQAFEHNGDGFIVMEYIDGSLCDDSDVLQVAAAVECLIGVIGPTTAPGPVGGGLIPHSFFVDRESSVTYDTVQALEKHINGVTGNFVLSFSYSLLLTRENDRSSHTRVCPNGWASKMKSAMAYVFAPAT